ncbi:tandem-95 repeat protein, partial [Aurantivibrio infirmus]
VANGTLTLNADGTFTYVPNANFNGTDSFVYEASDGNGGTAQATVTITVNAVNDTPTVVDDAYATNEDTTLTINLPNDVLANDSDIDGDSLTVNTTPVTDVANGTLTLNADGTFTYVPNANFNGTDSFVYEASDGNGGTAQATVTITVNAVNDTPTIVDDAYATNEDTTLTINLPNDVLANDSDIDGDTLTVNTTPVTD